MKITSHTTLVVGKVGKAEEIPPGTPVDTPESRDPAFRMTLACFMREGA